MKQDILSELSPLTTKLQEHGLYSKINSLMDLRVFMEHHVYSVWDFMCLVKSLQNKIAPSSFPWMPPQNKKLSRFINEIVLDEESDLNIDGAPMSHFEMYCGAIKEIGGNNHQSQIFMQNIMDYGLSRALEISNIPEPCIKFINKTMSFIKEDKPHILASAFAFGREQIIPLMFKSLLDKNQIKKEQAPMFHFYLDRHIELDGDTHGPISLEIVSFFCNGSKVKWEEAREAAKAAIEARIQFWDDIQKELSSPTMGVYKATHLNNTSLEKPKSEQHVST